MQPVAALSGLGAYAWQAWRKLVCGPAIQALGRRRETGCISFGGHPCLPEDMVPDIRSGLGCMVASLLARATTSALLRPNLYWPSESLGKCSYSGCDRLMPVLYSSYCPG